MESSIMEHVFCAGNGQNDTHGRPVFSNGRPNPNYLKPYDTITYAQVVELAAAQAVALVGLPKGQGWWMQASDYNGYDARFGNAQHANGKFAVMTGDIDSGTPPLEIVTLMVRRSLGEVRFLIWSTPGSTEESKRWRVIVPLAIAMTATGYKAIQHVWFSHLKEFGVTCDESLKNPGQIIYLPNRGSFYQWYEHQAPLFDPRTYSRLEAVQAYRATLNDSVPAGKDHDDYAPRLAVKQYFNTRDVMLAGGYVQGPGRDLQSYFSHDKKGFAVVIYSDGRWTSQHTGDRETYSGRSANGHPTGDVIDVLEKLHGWTPGTAVAVGNIIMAGFNPAGIPYPAVPQAAARWWLQKREELMSALTTQFGI
ncbi:hypothetical protein [Agrobacterium tumefaciens]|uniref:hypothetical protein n=1 Tax=Agrobacterium tumefaciens TaxID=358 RepID=UPI00122FC305